MRSEDHVPCKGRVLVVTYEFPPSAEMGGQACAQIARYLPEYGWEPTVLTVEDRYIQHYDFTTSDNLSVAVCRTRAFPHPLQVYRKMATNRKGYDRRCAAARIVQAPPGSIRRLKRWTLSLMLTPDDMTGWIPIAIARGRSLIRRERIDHILSSGPRWTNHLVGLGLKRLTGLPWTAHFRDPWTGLKRMDPDRPISALSTAIERWLEHVVVRHADRVVCVTERHSEIMRQTYSDLPPSKFVTIPNGYSPEEFEQVSNEIPNPRRAQDGQFAITYAGSLYIWRDPTRLMRSLRRLIDEEEFDPHGVVLNLVGWCEMARGRLVLETVRALRLEEMVRLPGSVSRRDALRYMFNSDLLLLLAEGLTLQIPGKTYEYLRVGKPILALTSEGALADLLRKTGGAWVVNPDDEEGITSVVREAYRCWKKGIEGPVAGKSVVASFDRRVLAGRFAELFESAGKGVQR